jgi:hypothetical protein
MELTLRRAAAGKSLAPHGQMLFQQLMADPAARAFYEERVALQSR